MSAKELITQANSGNADSLKKLVESIKEDEIELDNQNFEDIVNNSGVKVAVNALSSSRVEDQVAGSQLLSFLIHARDDESVPKQIAEANGVEALVNSVKGNNHDLKGFSLSVINHLCKNEEISKSFVKSGLIEILKPELESSNTDLLTGVIEVLDHLCVYESLSKTVSDAVGLETAFRLAKSDEEDLINGGLTLISHITKNVDASLDKFASLGVADLTVSKLNGNDEGSQQAAIEIILSTARHAETSKKFATDAANGLTTIASSQSSPLSKACALLALSALSKTQPTVLTEDVDKAIKEYWSNTTELDEDEYKLHPNNVSWVGSSPSENANILGLWSIAYLPLQNSSLWKQVLEKSNGFINASKGNANHKVSEIAVKAHERLQKS